MQDKIMLNISIPKITLEHLLQLQQISQQTFLEAFAEKNTEANMKKYLEAALSISKLTEELNDKNSEFYFITIDNQIIGYLKINFGAAQTELQNEPSLEIERIYVLKAFYGKKIGQLLFEKAIEIATEKSLAYVWLGVWEENLRAIHFYKKNGFEAFDRHIFKLGDDEQIDILMKLKLKK